MNYADSSNRPTSWAYPLNTFIGTSTINITGGQIENIIGASYGRNVNGTTIKSDAYYYGTINIKISGGTINSDIYGAGVGSTTGYNTNSSDAYKSYGANVTTSTNINISGGTNKRKCLWRRLCIFRKFNRSTATIRLWCTIWKQ